MYRGRESKKNTTAILDNLKEIESIEIWKRVTLNYTACRSRFGKGFGPFARLIIL